MKKSNKPSDFELLRQKAEEVMRQKVSGTGVPENEVEVLKLVHELEVHQIELELQNEELIRAKSDARMAATKYIELYDFAPTGYFKLDRTGRIIEMNFSGADMLNKTRLELRGRYFESFLSNISKSIFNHFLQKIFESETKKNCEITLITNGDTPSYLHLSGILTEDGEQCQVNALDITVLKRTEFELIKAKAKAEENDHLKSAFLANMSHEIRTPMNGVLGFTELLKEPLLKGEKRKKYIDIIEQCGNHLLSIIDDIINISKIEAGQMEMSLSETNLNDQINYVYTFFKPEARKKGIRLFLKNGLSSKVSTILTDRDKIAAILINLVKNAIKFTEKGSIEIGCRRKEPFLEFYVKDTGSGISIEQKEIIFERFRKYSPKLSLNYEGTGLGLSISKAYVELLGGKIWVESELGKGSEFYFTIPYDGSGNSQNVNTEKQEIFLKKPLAPMKGLKILIAEDDEFSEILIREAVKSFSKETITVKSGIEAIESSKSNPDIDLILMDNRMSEMAGYDATRQIRKFNRTVVIIIQTAMISAEEYQKAMNVGCNDLISKPFDKDVLEKVLKKHFKAGVRKVNL